MTIYQLSEDQIKKSLALPEVAMATQVATDNNNRKLVIASGRIAIAFDDRLERELGAFMQDVPDGGLYDRDAYGARAESWASNLPSAPTLNFVPPKDAWPMLAFIPLGPRFPLPGVPYRPSYTHGHLPFHGTCGGVEKYYRYEQFPTSRRIDMNTASVIAKDTYGAPASEEPFTPTGLSAVGRFALPLLLPACWRYELTPPVGTRVFYGASVPLYGQSGGAVEVMFPDLFKNVGAIPAAYVLPIL